MFVRHCRFGRHLLAGLVLAGALLQAPLFTGPAQAQVGRASWYALTSITASGERANPEAMTAAHRTLPLGTWVRVLNLENGRAALLRINDRGPYVDGRIIDVTRAAARRLGFVEKGVTRVSVQVVGRRRPLPSALN